MNRALVPIALASALLAGPVLADDFRSCREIGIHFGAEATARAEETLTLPFAKTPHLTVDPNEHGGVDVAGWDRSEWQVSVCKVASGYSEAEAQELLSRVSASLHGDELTADGPAEDGWTVFFLVRAPQGADLTLLIENGPASVKNLRGKVEIRAQNGPVTTRNVSGQLGIDASNGPVTLSGASGQVDVKAQNGPLTLDLSGDRWDGAGLRASAQNGPLVLRLPEGYASGVRVSASGHTPLRCRAAQCDGMPRGWDDENEGYGRHGSRGRRTLELGSGSPLVDVTTQNGPVIISNSRS